MSMVFCHLGQHSVRARLSDAFALRTLIKQIEMIFPDLQSEKPKHYKLNTKHLTQFSLNQHVNQFLFVSLQA
jgi:hypothetical protein